MLSDSPATAGPTWQMIAMAAIAVIQMVAIGVGRAVLQRLQSQGETLVRIESALFGAQGDNGINGDMKDMKTWRHKEINRRHAVLARLFRLEAHCGLEAMPPGDA